MKFPRIGALVASSLEEACWECGGEEGAESGALSGRSQLMMGVSERGEGSSFFKSLFLIIKLV